jgi:hypothetical protein
MVNAITEKKKLNLYLVENIKCKVFMNHYQ